MLFLLLLFLLVTLMDNLYRIKFTFNLFTYYCKGDSHAILHGPCVGSDRNFWESVLCTCFTLVTFRILFLLLPLQCPQDGSRTCATAHVQKTTLKSFLLPAQGSRTELRYHGCCQVQPLQHLSGHQDDTFEACIMVCESVDFLFVSLFKRFYVTFYLMDKLHSLYSFII